MLPKTPRQGEFVRFVDEENKIWPGLIVYVHNYSLLDLWVFTRSTKGPTLVDHVELHPGRAIKTWHWPNE